MNKKQWSVDEVIINGLATSPGFAIGPVYIFRPQVINLLELEEHIENSAEEIRHLNKAMRQVMKQLVYAQKISETSYGEKFTDIFESQKSFLRDEFLIKEITDEIHKARKSAAHSVSKILSEKSEYFINLENTYFRERAFDILDLKQKIIHALFGIGIDYQLTNPSIVVAESLSPTDTIHFNRKFILGFITDKGGKTSHATILAKGLQIPAVINGNNLSHILKNEIMIIMDGFSGQIIINPTTRTVQRYEHKKQAYLAQKEKLFSDAGRESKTADMVPVELLANVEFLHEIPEVLRHAAGGVGLFRTESIFLEHNGEPDEDTQFEIYRKLAKKLAPHPVTIRTIDLGGDKLIEGYTSKDELNPFLGWRAIRFCLDRPAVFKNQLRAIYRASVFGNVQILLPMISSLEEIIQTREIITVVKEELQAENISYIADIPLGVMIETPAAAIHIGALCDYADFFSIGTNDLTQYVLAIDRTNDKVSHSFNTFHPAVLNLVGQVIRTANERKREVTLCGEFASVPEAIPLLLGMGLRRFSMNPFSIPYVRRQIAGLNIAECEAIYSEISTYHLVSEIEQKMAGFLEEKGLKVVYLIEE